MTERDLEREIRRSERLAWVDEHRTGLALLVAMAVAAAIAVAVMAMTSGPSDGDAASAGSSGDQALGDGVAAAFDGAEIREDEVTAFIEQYRHYAGYDSDGEWATYMDGMSEEPADVREEAIRMLARRVAVEERAAELGIEATDEEVDGRLAEEMAEAGHEGDWEEYVTGTLFYEDADGYRDDIRQKVLMDKLLEVDVDPIEPTELDLYNQANGGGYTGRHAYDITFPVDGGQQAAKEAAQAAYDEISDDCTLERAVEVGKAAVEDGTASTACDDAWTCLGSFTTAYLDAIDSVDVGQACEPFRDEDGWHVLYVTEEFGNRNDYVVSVADMPEAIYERLRGDTMNSLVADAEVDYADSLVSAGELIMADMPSALSYDVDMSQSQYRIEATEDEEAKEAEEASMLNGDDGGAGTDGDASGDGEGSDGE